jgi:hypothetical protein
MSIRIYTSSFNRQGGGFWIFMILAGILLLGAAFFLGIAAVIQFIYPLIYALSLTAAGVFLLFVVPLSLFKRFRLSMTGASLAIGQIISISVWMYAFLFLVNELKWLAFFLMFLFQAVTPIAIIGLLLKGETNPGLVLALGALTSLGIKSYAAWLAASGTAGARGSSQNDRAPRRSSDIIDIEGHVEE